MPSLLLLASKLEPLIDILFVRTQRGLFGGMRKSFPFVPFVHKRVSFVNLSFAF